MPNSLCPGKDPNPWTFTLRPATKQQLATLAEAAGCSRSDFVDLLIVNFGSQLAAYLLAIQEGDDANRDHEGGADHPGGGEGS